MSDIDRPDNPDWTPSFKRLKIPYGEMNEPDTLITPQVSTFVGGEIFYIICKLNYFSIRVPLICGRF